MDVRIFFCIAIFAAVTRLSSAACELSNTVSSCKYTVICIGNPGSVSNANCDGEPDVTFAITASDLTYLTTGFFSATNFDSRVRTIIGIGNSWTTIDTSAFRYYAKCIKLNLSNNKIENIRNEAFRNLNNLRYLNVSYNRISKLLPKTFLISDSRESSVQLLDLSFNNLIQLSSEINELPNLKVLFLQNNDITSIADDAFMNLKNLNELNLKNNNLRSLNLTLTNLRLLANLDLSNNHLLKLAGYEINRLVAIKYFNVSHNNLTFVDSNCFIQAFDLQVVDFSFNHINSNIENVMLINNNKLEYLDFFNNSITTIQENSFSHGNFTYINFENNFITGDIKENTFTGLRNITKLDLSRQNIKAIRNNAFSGMTSLLNLNLTYNAIGTIENSSFVNSKVAVLDLSHNNISLLNFMKDCLLNLTELYLNNNNITHIPTKTLENKLKIKILDLSMNRIFTIDANSLPLLNLQYFNITGNKLQGVIRKNMFSPAKYLRFLDLSNFNITKIDESSFVDLTVLARLNLSNNNIKEINPNNFKGVDNLYSFDISNNNLTDLTFNTNILTNLKALYLNNNKITNVSRLFSNKSKLLYLDVSNNNISDLSSVGANLLPNITVLQLGNNKIRHFNKPSTNTLATLIVLGLSSNQIDDINLSYFKDLLSVDLSNNNLNYINSSLLKSNEYLQSLDVSRNNITDLPPGTFQFMKNLKLLNLSSNYLTKLRYGSLRGLHKTEVLDLSRNDITVLDVDVFHECDELKTLIIDYNRIKTFDVERLILISLRKLRTLSLGGNPISCKEIVRNIKSSNTTFYALRQVEVTSVDKIYHEDNVHGIKCGDGDDTIVNENVFVKPEAVDSTDSLSSMTSTTVVLVWCSILTLILVGGGAVVYYKLYKKRVVVLNSNMSLQMRNSIDMEGSDFQNDLLG